MAKHFTGKKNRKAYERRLITSRSREGCFVADGTMKERKVVMKSSFLGILNALASSIITPSKLEPGYFGLVWIVRPDEFFLFPFWTHCDSCVLNLSFPVWAAHRRPMWAVLSLRNREWRGWLLVPPLFFLQLFVYFFCPPGFIFLAFCYSASLVHPVFLGSTKKLSFSWGNVKDGYSFCVILKAISRLFFQFLTSLKIFSAFTTLYVARIFVIKAPEPQEDKDLSKVMQHAKSGCPALTCFGAALSWNCILGLAWLFAPGLVTPRWLVGFRIVSCHI